MAKAKTKKAAVVVDEKTSAVEVEEMAAEFDAAPEATDGHELPDFVRDIADIGEGAPGLALRADDPFDFAVILAAGRMAAADPRLCQVEKDSFAHLVRECEMWQQKAAQRAAKG